MSDYNHIENFLDRFKKILFAGEAANQAIAETITKNIGHEVTTKMFKIKGTLIHIQGSPMLRSEVLIHERDILAELAMLLPNRRFTNIR